MIESACVRPSFDGPTVPLTYPVIVLAEDDEQLRRSLSDFLAEEGFLVREVGDVEGLRAALESDDARVLLLDVYLADGDCGDVVADLVGSPRCPHIVLMSAHADAGRIALTHGVELLPKPFDLEVLIQALLVPLDDRTSND